jgi:hypothetical protein
MATEASHAAWHTQRRFAVRLLAEPGPARDLADELPDLLSAIDLAVDWLDREDLSRDRDIRLAVVETRDGVPTEVWTYPPTHEPSAGQELVQRLGFNPAAWRPPTQTNPGTRPTGTRTHTPSQPPERVTPHTHDPEPPPPPYPPVASSPTAQPETANDATHIRIAQPTTPAARAAAPAILTDNLDIDNAGRPKRPAWPAARWIAATIELTWDNRASRCCLIIAAASLWLAVALTEPIFLITLLASIAGLWTLRRHQTPTTDPDDWL